ncbi:hypothetical protein L6164_022027 [Bauhinia variegata]|uniref:Uncharacterized protein n=1 Tax=Bauhinia variegata TaxID=167791 RepID=A0ACB9MFD3_BAUVA|nr:hypothetical protein L6164_022027 [Bauhinia variegata]
MTGMDGRLDFEIEDELIKVPEVNKKRKKVIGLDELLTDFYKEQSERVEKEAKRKKERKKKSYEYDDFDRKEAALTRLVEKCHDQMKTLGDDEEFSVWGMQLFGSQKEFPPLHFPELDSCNLLRSFMDNKLNCMVELTADKGDIFLEGLLTNGWLSKLVFLCGHIEKSVSIWVFNTMLYSSKEELQTSACNLWRVILSSRKEADQFAVKIDWFPEYMHLRRALKIYGFLFNFSPTSAPMKIDSSCGGPPQNIRAWIKFVTACCRIRSKISIFSAVEAEEIAQVIICLFLDRLFEGLLVLLDDCMQAVISYFTDQEWSSSCENIAKYIACRVSKDFNCIQAAECISKVNSRSKQLRSEVAYQSLLLCFDGVTNGEEILRSVIAINVKDKKCDLFKMYIYLILTENWLLSDDSTLEEKPVICEMFRLYLKNCSCLISGADMRSFASKIRHRAAYLMQFSFHK